jgi:hypothetical protein
MDNPQVFDLGLLPYLLRETERCCEEAEKALGILHQRLLSSRLQQDKTLMQDEHSQPLPVRRASRRSINSQVSSMSRTPPSNLFEAHATRDMNVRPRSADGKLIWGNEASVSSKAPSNFNNDSLVELSTSGFVDTLKETHSVLGMGQAALEKTDLEVKPTVKKLSPGVGMDGFFSGEDEIEVPKPLNILKKGKVSEKDGLGPIQEGAPNYEAVITEKPKPKDQIEKPLPPPPSEDFQSRSSVYSTSSLSPISSRASCGSTSLSVVSTTFSDSLAGSSRSNSQHPMAREWSQGGLNPSSPRPSSQPLPNIFGPVMLGRNGSNKLSTYSSFSSQGRDSTNIPRTGSERSRREPEVLVFRPPDSPPLSQGRQSGTDEWRNLNLPGKIQAPNSDEIVEGGLEVVGQTLVSDPGLILAKEDQPEPEPTITTAVQSLGHPIRHDASFFKYGGFCGGAKLMQRRVGGALKVVKKPGVSMPFCCRVSPY